MAHDLWEELAKEPIPPPPETFDRGVHERINSQLLTGHLVDFYCRALPYALWHFARGIFGVILFSLTGRFQLDRRLPRPDFSNSKNTTDALGDTELPAPDDKRPEAPGTDAADSNGPIVGE